MTATTQLEKRTAAAITAANPEVLAPAGDRECLRAAVENGADAVYFGLRDHNARARATNFDLEELPEVMQLLHRRGVKGYVALNTLVFTKELDGLERVESGASAAVQSPEPLAAATRHPLSIELLREQLGRLGATVYTLLSLEADIQGEPIVPLSVLNKMRHELICQLDASVDSLSGRTVSHGSVLAHLHEAINSYRSPISGHLPELRVLCRTQEQLRAVLAAGVKSVYADFQDIRDYAHAVAMTHAAGADIFLATPRIQKPAEGPLFKHLLRHGADGILVRNLGGLVFYTERHMPVVADFSLNAANELTVQLLRERGADRVTASYDLNAEQLRDLVSAVPPQWLEIVIHQHMPMFHMEHCVFCAFLSPGTDRTNCGRPCDQHEVKLRDRVGMEHPLKADVGCRNTLFNAALAGDRDALLQRAGSARRRRLVAGHVAGPDRAG